MIGKLGRAALIGGLLVAPHSAPAAAQIDLDSPAPRALSELSGCVSGADVLLTAIVVDESGSLRSTDPGAERVSAVQTAVDALQELQRTVGTDLDVEVTLSTFAGGYEELVPWGTLQDGHADTLREAAGELAGRDDGDLTDYRKALAGAMQQLNDRASERPGDSVCKVVLWFTDGGLDVAEETSAAAVDLCRERGLVDAVRGNQVVLLALALFTDGGSVGPAEREQLRAIAEGTADGAECGTLPIRSDAATGAYLPAEEASLLRRLFARAVTVIQGLKPDVTVMCPRARCPDGRFRTEVDRGVAGFRLIVDSSPDATPILTDPRGDTVTLDGGRTGVPVAGGILDVSVRNGLIVSTARFESLTGPQVGRWTLEIVDAAGTPEPATVDRFWDWGAEITSTSALRVVAGETTPVAVTLLGPHGSPLDPAVYGELRMTATINGQEAQVHNGSKPGSYRVDVTLPISERSTAATLLLAATAVTTPSSVRLGPISTEMTLDVGSPPPFPTIQPATLDLNVVGSATAEGLLTVRGSRLGPTRACLMGADVSGPPDAGTVRITATPDCVDLPGSGVAELAIHVAPDRVADGHARGSLQIALTGAEGAGTRQVEVPVSVGLTRPVDPETRLWVALALVAASLLLPVIFLWLANWWLGRFMISESLRVAALDVVLGPRGLRRASSERAALLASDDFRYVGTPRSRRRRLTLAGTPVELVAGRPRVLREPRAYARTSASNVIVSNIAPYAGASPQEAPASFAPADAWFLVGQPSGEQGDHPATLVVLLDDGGRGLGLNDRIRQITRFDAWDAHRAAFSRPPADGADDQQPERREPASQFAKTAANPGARPDPAQSKPPEEAPPGINF